MLPATMGEVNGEEHPNGGARPIEAENPFGGPKATQEKRWLNYALRWEGVVGSMGFSHAAFG